MTIISIPLIKPSPYYVYALIAHDVGRGYVKFGMSKAVTQRLSGLKTGCPVPIHYIAVVDVANKHIARNVEASLHKRFEVRNTQGEWFWFDFASLIDKREFNDGCRDVFLTEIGSGHWWTKISVKALEDDERQRRINLVRSPHYRKIRRKAIEEAKSRRAWKELSR